MNYPGQGYGPSLVGQGPQYGTQSGETATDLRRQLHTMKIRDREAATFASQASIAEKITRGPWFTAALTGLGVFFLLYIANPIFIQDSREKYSVARPNFRRLAAWSILAALIVGLGPFLYEKFFSH